MTSNPTFLQARNGKEDSLARKMANMITEIQDLFGPRDERYFFIGWEFDGEHPQLQLPGSGLKLVLIRLSMGASVSWNAAVHELAHECVHLLSPVAGMTNNLEEGVATWYQTQFYKREFDETPAVYGPYLGAFEAVEDLFEHSESGASVIKDLRSKSLAFGGISASDILAAAPTLDDQTAEYLVRQWSPGSARTQLI